MSLLLVGAGTSLGALVGADSGWVVLVPGLCVTGLGGGLASPVLAAAARNAAPPQRAGMDNAAMTTFRQLGYAVALPVLATLAAAGQARGVLAGSGALPDPGRGQGPDRRRLPGPARRGRAGRRAGTARGVCGRTRPGLPARRHHGGGGWAGSSCSAASRRRWLGSWC